MINNLNILLQILKRYVIVLFYRSNFLCFVILKGANIFLIIWYKKNKIKDLHIYLFN